MIANLIYEIPTKQIHGVKTALINQKKGLELNKVEVRLNSYKLDSDVNHCYFFGPISTWELKFSKKCFITGLHLHINELKYVNGSYFILKILNYFLKKSDVLLAPSNFAKKEFKKYYPDKPISVLSGGVDINKFKMTKRKRISFRNKYGFNEDDFLVFCVGHTNYIKGVDTFVNVAKKLREINFIWIGSTYKHLKKNFQPSKIKLDNLFFTGYVDDITEAIAGCDLFFFPTYFELQGIPVLEAMASKKPVITRNIPSFDWLINRETCLKSNTIEDFCSNILELRDDKKLSKKLVRNSINYVKKHDVKNVGKKLKMIYEFSINKSYDELDEIDEY
jgi:1,2-diacylglycerol-3-alpha-glucose alpha-1,2-glucosyltransferase